MKHMAIGILLLSLTAAMAAQNAGQDTIATSPATSGKSNIVLAREVHVSTVLWSPQRIKAYEDTLSTPVEPLAVLTIPALKLEAPVLEGTDEFALNRGVGRITKTSLPGQGGNIGIAGHRDGFFRGLKDIKKGDRINLITPSGTEVYVVNRVRVTVPTDVSMLRPRKAPALTLVACYPFYFSGHAPRRYIVEASLTRQAGSPRNRAIPQRRSASVSSSVRQTRKSLR